MNAALIIRALGALVFGLALYFSLFSFGGGPDRELFFLRLIVLPLSLGFSSVLIVDPEKRLSINTHCRINAALTFALSLILLFLAFEMIICVIFIAPAFWGVQVFGVVAAYALLPSNPDGKMRVVLLTLPLLAALPLPLPEAPERVVTRTDTIHIAASPEAVWQQITVFGDVQPAERLWTFTHALGAPAPIRSAITGDSRLAEWTKGVSYHERLTVIDPGARMNWVIDFGEDFQMAGYDRRIHPASYNLYLLDGSYVLSPSGEGTQVTLSARYRLRTYMNAYVALWGAVFLGDNHRSILHVLKLRAEAAT